VMWDDALWNGVVCVLCGGGCWEGGEYHFSPLSTWNISSLHIPSMRTAL